MVDARVVDASHLVPLPVAEVETAWVVSALKALADPTRLEIVGVLGAAGEVCVCNLSGRFAIPQNLLSHHLRVLREAGLIHGRKRGRWVDYRLDAGAMARVQAAIGRLAALKKRVEEGGVG